MKLPRLFAKTFWLGLIVTAAMVLTVFKLSPSFAYSTTMPSAQVSAAKTTIIAQSDNSAYTSAGAARSLYQRLGGYNKIARVIDETTKNVFNDPLIGKYFIGLSTNSKQRLRQLLVDQFCEAAGGPCVYTGRTMKLSHSGIGGGLTNDEFNAFSNGVAAALDTNKVPQQEKNEVLGFVESLRSPIVEK